MIPGVTKYNSIDNDGVKQDLNIGQQVFRNGKNMEYAICLSRYMDFA